MMATRLFTIAVMGMSPPRSALTEAAAAARKALDIEPRHPCALACAGMVSAALDWNWPEFERLMRQAYKLAPDDPDVATYYAFWYLRRKGRYSEGLKIYESVAIRDPLSSNWPAFQAALAYHGRDYAKAKSCAKTAIEIDGAQMLAHWVMCGTATQTGEIELALASGAEAVRLSDGHDWVRGTYATTLAKAGHHDEALAIRDCLRESATSRYVMPFAIANACVACQDTEGALAAMEQLADDRSPNIFWLMDEPELDPVRRHPRCSALLARIGLPERY